MRGLIHLCLAALIVDGGVLATSVAAQDSNTNEAPPALQIIHEPVQQVVLGRAVPIAAKVRPVLGSAFLLVRYKKVSGSEFEEVGLRRVIGEDYFLELPGALLVDGGLDYYLVAVSRDGDEIGRFPEGDSVVHVSTIDEAATADGAGPATDGVPDDAESTGGSRTFLWVGLAAGAGLLAALLFAGGGDSGDAPTPDTPSGDLPGPPDHE